jgi:hypothetical protein
MDSQKITQEQKAMKSLILLIVITLFSFNVYSQKTPTFGKYPAKVEKKTARAINFGSHPKARTFRTNLRNSLRNGKIDFAGKYIVARWGCGTGCSQMALIDAKTGNVFFPTILQGALTGMGSFGDVEKVIHRAKSRLLILNGFPGVADPDGDATEQKQGTRYYQWTGRDFKLLKFVEKPVN